MNRTEREWKRKERGFHYLFLMCFSYFIHFLYGEMGQQIDKWHEGFYDCGCELISDDYHDTTDCVLS